MRYKLVSREDTLLGHIDLPDQWFKPADRHATVALPFMSRVPIAVPSAVVAPIADIVRVTLIRAPWSQFPDAICLTEGTLEQLETLKDISFSPSAAYLRTLVL